MNWYLMVIKNYVGFSGRARRKEYWMYTLFTILFAMVAAILDSMVGSNIYPLPYGYIYSFYAVATFLPGLAVVVRRLHDVGKSGWMCLIIFIPIIGFIWLLVLLCTNGQAGENKYGPDPKNGTSFNEDALDSHLTA
jgi:uncharacterized membrane protein YhaH (DUF805 family)